MQTTMRQGAFESKAVVRCIAKQTLWSEMYFLLLI
jgi:hypothetical protein